MHKVSDQPMTPPPAPKFTVEGKTLKLDLAGYPTQYRVSNEKDFAGSEWQFVNVNDGAMQLQIDTGKPFYVQTKNSFGESQVAEGR